MTILQNYDLTEHSTFRLPARAAYFATAYTHEDIAEAYNHCRKNKVQLLPLGKGSNIIFGTELIDKFLLEIDVTGFQIDQEGLVTIGAGEIWDEIVSRCVDMNLAGIECLSAIPGTAGATPVQNVGAYGQEISDTFVKLSAFDIETGEFVELTASDCEFAYRDSIFKKQKKKRYIITEITLQLKKDGPPTLTYESLSEYLRANGLSDPSLQQVREAVIAIRKIKLPDPSVVPNAGSFFKNPIIEKSKAHSLQQNYPNLPYYDTGNEQVKLSAGWLIENSGLKGYKRGNFGIYDKNALVLVHHGSGTISELKEFIELVKHKVKSKFNIELHQEPETIA